MTRVRRLILLLAALLAPSALATAGAAAAPAGWLDPLDVEVDGGEASWHTGSGFYVRWHRVLGPSQPPFPTAIDYALQTADGTPVAPARRIAWNGDQIVPVSVPPIPGRYRVELWLEGEGTTGAHASAQLLFDDSRPSPPRVQAPPAWFGGGSEPVLRLEPPAAAEPPSGIAGYAVSVDRGGPSAPCEGAGHCPATAISPRGDGGADTVALGVLPEGAAVVRVASVSGAGVPSAKPAEVVVHVDRTGPEVRLGGVPRGWAGGPVEVHASAGDSASGMAAAGPNGPVTAIAVDGGGAAVSAGPAASATVVGSGLHRVSSYARDAAGNRGHGAAVVRIDEEPPRVAFARAQDPAEPERIRATVGDRLSGPDDRGSIAVRAAGSRLPFTPLSTAAAGGALSAVWDSDAFPPGSYEFRVTGYDRAGNATTTDRRDDGARMVLANPLKRRTRLLFGFGGRRLVWQRCARVGAGRRCHRQVTASYQSRPAERATNYGHGTLVSGRLTAATGEPLAGRAIHLVESFDAGATLPSRTTVVQTGANGGFSARLAPGPSRRVEAVFAGSPVLCRTSGRAVRLRVLAAVRLRASSARAKIGGAPVVFSGRVAGEGAANPATGRPVELQFRVPGRRWSEFRTVRTDARGRFRYAYAFADDDSRGVRFQFRAFAPAADSWPYEAASSRPVFVTGR